MISLLFAVSAHMTVSSPDVDLFDTFQVQVEVEGVEPNFERLKKCLPIRGNKDEAVFDLVDMQVETSDVKQLYTFTLEPVRGGATLVGPFVCEWDGGSVLTNYERVQVSAPDVSTNIDLPELLPVSERPQLAISRDNRSHYIDGDDHFEKMKNEVRDRLRSRRLPWRSLALAMGALALAGGAVWGSRRLPQKSFFSKPIDPYERALRELSELENSALLHDHAFEPFYVRLTAIVRHYIEAQVGLKAPEMTTEEFLAHASCHPRFDIESRDLLSRFLLKADTVKFARGSSSLQEGEEALTTARRVLSALAG